MDDKLTEILVVLDRSGSMISCQKDMEGGLREFLKKQKALNANGLRANFTFVKFDTVYEKVYDGVSLEHIEIDSITLDPRGGTALLDAMGRTINEVGERLNKTPEDKRPSKVVVVVITDGEENSSREFSKEQISEIVKRQRETYKWEFVYLGANQDSFTVAKTYGFTAGSTANFTTSYDGISGSYGGLSENLTAYRCCSAQSMDFSDKQRQDMMVDDKT